MDYRDLFSALEGGGLEFLVSGGLALVLHGIPRMSGDVDLIVAPGAHPEAERLLASLGYGPRPGGAAGEHPVLRLMRGGSDLPEVDLDLDPFLPFPKLQSRAVKVCYESLEVPLVGLEDMAALKERMSRPADGDDLESIRVLGKIEAGGEPAPGDLRADQIAKFRRWTVEKRLRWLLTSLQLTRQMPEGEGGGGRLRGRGALRRRRVPGLDHTDLS